MQRLSTRRQHGQGGDGADVDLPFDQKGME